MKKIKNLEKRYQIERNFHDAWAKNIKPSDVNYKGAFQAVTAVENKFALSQMGELRGKTILDLGCGMGDASMYFALRGAKVYAIDISPEMIKLVKRIARKLGYSRQITAKVMVAEKLEFSSSTFDYVFGNGILHHVVPDMALKEVYRVLKPGGVATFIEPLGYNPIINVYRRMARRVRTPFEVPLNYSQLNTLTQAKFRKMFHKEFHLTTLLIFLWFFVGEGVDPNEERYWKKIIDDADKVGSVFLFLRRIDEAIFKLAPAIKRYSWNTVLIYQK